MDIIKGGLGSGSACTIRNEAGVGEAHLKAGSGNGNITTDHGVYLSSDGGHHGPGTGADFVMLGLDLYGATGFRKRKINICHQN